MAADSPGRPGSLRPRIWPDPRYFIEPKAFVGYLAGAVARSFRADEESPWLNVRRRITDFFDKSGTTRLCGEYYPVQTPDQPAQSSSSAALRAFC